jgi:hypothetical protein
MFGFILGAAFTLCVLMACTTRTLWGQGGLLGSRFWLIVIPVSVVLIVSGYGGLAVILLIVSFYWMCAHYYGYPNRRWDGSCYRRWYY